MKKILTITAIFLAAFTLQSQSIFTYDKNGLAPEYIVIELDTIPQEELYSKTINWIKETYKNADEVINNKIENQKIFIEGINSSVLTIGGGAKMDARYTIEIAFKEGKIKFQPTRLEYYYSVHGWNNISLGEKAKNFYKRNGSPRGVYKHLPNQITGLFNDLAQSLKDYILEKNVIKEDW
jgi:hypothetical protein